MKIKISSYKKAQAFKKDYVRVNGSFVRFQKTSDNHSDVILDLEEGTEFEARGSKYREGLTKWDAQKAQSWAKFVVRDGVLVALNFDNQVVPLPGWVTVIEQEVCA